MKHPFELLRAEYESLMPSMVVTKATAIQKTAARLVSNYHEGRYTSVSKQTGVPIIFMAASFEREASSDFTRSPAQGDRWNRVSVNVPAGRGPFESWAESAIDAYALNGLDKVGVGNWTWPRVCYFGELFNGFGPRDAHHMRSSYLWGGTNLQQRGKYIRDHVFDDTVMDVQLGVVPIMMAMVLLEPELRLPGVWPFRQLAVAAVPSGPPIKSPLAAIDVAQVQARLNKAGFGPLVVDGSFGRCTSAAVRAFEAANGLVPDGLLDQQTVDKLKAA